MKRSVLPLIVAILLIGGGGYARGAVRSTSGPPPTIKPTDLPGNQPQVDAGDAQGPRTIGTKNAVTTREYIPLAAPCRLYDSRKTGGVLASNAVRTIPLSACPGIPSTATALDASISTIDPTHQGYLRAWANGASEPTQTLLQWGASANTAGATITASSSGIKIHSYGGPTHVAVDVAGYYQPGIYADILPASTTEFAAMYSSSSMIAGYSSDLGSPGQIVIATRRDITYCDIQATAEGPAYTATAVQYSSTQLVVRVRDMNGNAARAYASVVVNC